MNKPQSVTLEQALADIAFYLNIDAATLIGYAAEDPHDGWDEGRGSWPVGSLWTVEGKVLYALTRALGITNAVELGTRYGCSATHIAEALKANGAGKLTTVDAYVHGPVDLRIPSHLDEYTSHVIGEAVSYLADVEGAPDLIFEDLDHETATVAAVAGIAEKRLKPGGVLVVHDAMHFLVGERIRRGLELAKLPARMWLIAPSDCGIALWVKPKTYEDGYFEGIDRVILPGYIPEGEVPEVVDIPPVKSTKSKRKTKTT